MATKRHTLSRGAILGDTYRITEILGDGGLGPVYAAVELPEEREVAVKLLNTKYLRGQETVDRFISGIKRASGVKHPLICDIIGVGVHDGDLPFAVMPRLGGRSLKTMLKEGVGTDRNRVVDIACQTLRALGAAHRDRVAHRDLSPSSIFVIQDAGGDRVKLLDLGLADVISTDLTASNAAVGVILRMPRYKSPEQVRGESHVDFRADIYAMGVILYEALTGMRPYDGGSYNEIMFKIMSEPFLSPSRVSPNVPPELEQIILTAMARDPSARYQSADAMRQALESFKPDVSADGLTARSTAATVSDIPFAAAKGGNAFAPTTVNQEAAPAKPSSPPSRPSPPPLAARPDVNWMVVVVMLVAIAVLTAIGVVAVMMRHPAETSVTVPLNPPPTVQPAQPKP